MNGLIRIGCHRRLVVVKDDSIVPLSPERWIELVKSKLGSDADVEFPTTDSRMSTYNQKVMYVEFPQHDLIKIYEWFDEGVVPFSVGTLLFFKELP